MEIFHLTNKKYIVSCPECSEILKFEIDPSTMSVSGECKNGHIMKNKSIEYFYNNCVKSSNEYNNKCYYCYEEINDNFNNFICLRCNKLLCGKYINIHKRQEKHNIRRNFISQSRLCQKHERKFLWYCETCKLNLCDECKIFHYNHSIKSFLDVIPTAKDKELISINIGKFKEHIDLMNGSIEVALEDIRQRCKKLHYYSHFLEDINEKLFKNYNASFFDYYNFENIKYISNLMNNEQLYSLDKYFDYLLCVGKLEIEEEGVKKKKKKNNKKLVLDNLNYYKDNLFLSYKQKTIYINEFKNFSFNQVVKYDIEFMGQIYSLKPAIYRDDIFINFRNKKNIKFLKYDDSDKTFKLSNEEIRGFKIYPQRNFVDYLDNKNGNIISLDNTGKLTVWKNNKNKNYRSDILINGNFKDVFNINDSLFGAKDENKIIKIFNTDNYNCIKNIDFKYDSSYIGLMQNKFIIFNCSSENKIFLVDANYLDLVQIIGLDHINYSPIVKNQHLFIFYLDNNNLINIKKAIYNKYEGRFIVEGIIETKIETEFLPKIIDTNSDNVVLSEKNKFILLKI